VNANAMLASCYGAASSVLKHRKQSGMHPAGA